MKQLLLIWFTLSSIVAFTQTTLFSETFETGNSLTLANGTQTNKWYRGTVNSCNGTGALYVSNNSSAYTYTNTSTSVVHAYFNIVVPASVTSITLTFNYKLAGEASYDDLKVFSFASSVAAPAAGTAVTTNASKVLLATYQGITTCTGASLSLGAIAGTTRKIVFQWRNDVSGGVTPPALIDNITVTYTNPTAPTCASLSAPSNGAMGCPLNQVISWAATATATGYDVYFGTSGTPPLVSSNQVGTTYTPALAGGTIYYFKIVPLNGVGNASGCNTWSFTTVSPPTNNSCASAPSLTINSGTSCTTSSNGTTVGASQSAVACAGTADDDVWYSFVATSTTQTITVTPGTMSDAVFQVFSGTCAAATSLICVDNTSGTSLETSDISGLTIGSTYLIRVHSYGNGTGQGTFSICATTPCSTPTTAGTLSSNKSTTTVNDAVIFTTSGNSGSITKFEWSYDNFSTITGTTTTPTNPYTFILNVQQSTIYFRTTSVSGTCPAGVTPTISVTLQSAPAYVYGAEDGDYISNVTLNTLNNNSTYDLPLGDSYQDFTSITTTLVKGTNYTIYVSSPTTFMSSASGYAAWIDWDNDGIFQTSENIMQTTYGNTKSQSFTVPSTASIALVKMRVLSVWSTTPTTDAYYSTGYSWGEIEEYKINITAALPTELYTFNGTNKGENNHLFWVTSSEQNTSHFNLQKSRDGIDWTTITTLNAAGNSTNQIEYDVTDYKVEAIINYYRLQQYDLNGVYETFGPIAINNSTTDSTKIIVKYVNLRGQEIDLNNFTSAGVYIEVYSDGTMRKVYR